MTDCYHQSLLHFRVQNTQCRFYEARILEVLSCGSRKYLEIQSDNNIQKNPIKPGVQHFLTSGFESHTIFDTILNEIKNID